MNAPSAVADRVDCKLCGTPAYPRRVGATPMLLCPRCGLGRVAGMDAGADYWGGGQDEEVAERYWTTAREAMFRRALARLAGRSRGRLLDLGGGIGFFAELAARSGWDAYSLDVSPPARQAAAERLGADRSLGPEDVARVAGTCDVVTMWCVVAHGLDPLGLLRQAADLLVPGGRLLLTTPNFLFQAGLARLLYRLDKPYDLVSQDHVLHFTPQALGDLLRRSGFPTWSYEYLGVTEYCIVSPRFAPAMVPLKRAWNVAGTAISRCGLPPLSGELQVIATREASPG